MANPTMNIGVTVSLKTGTILLTAPDGELYPVKAVEDPAETAKLIGQQVLEIYKDPGQREAAADSADRAPSRNAQRVTRDAPAPSSDGARVNGAGAPMTNTEVHVRAALDSAVPGGSRLLDWLQDLSGTGEGNG